VATRHARTSRLGLVMNQSVVSVVSVVCAGELLGDAGEADG
jgi:hypothetical protein